MPHLSAEKSRRQTSARDTWETERDGLRGRSPSPGHSPRVNTHPVRKVSPRLAKLRFIDSPEVPTQATLSEQSSMDGCSGEVLRRVSRPGSSLNGTATPSVGPSPVPLSPSLNMLPSNQAAVNNTTGVGPRPGPIRHPRPLTAADLHLQPGKEQDAVVRLNPAPTHPPCIRPTTS